MSTETREHTWSYRIAGLYASDHSYRRQGRRRLSLTRRAGQGFNLPSY